MRVRGSALGALGTDTEPDVSCLSGDNVQGEAEARDNLKGPFGIPGDPCVPSG